VCEGQRSRIDTGRVHSGTGRFLAPLSRPPRVGRSHLAYPKWSICTLPGVGAPLMLWTCAGSTEMRTRRATLLYLGVVVIVPRHLAKANPLGSAYDLKGTARIYLFASSSVAFFLILHRPLIRSRVVPDCFFCWERELILRGLRDPSDSREVVCGRSSTAGVGFGVQLPRAFMDQRRPPTDMKGSAITGAASGAPQEQCPTEAMSAAVAE